MPAFHLRSLTGTTGTEAGLDDGPGQDSGSRARRAAVGELAPENTTRYQSLGRSSIIFHENTQQNRMSSPQPTPKPNNPNPHSNLPPKNRWDISYAQPAILEM